LQNLLQGKFRPLTVILSLGPLCAKWYNRRARA
jgi:hypothetical protein